MSQAMARDELASSSTNSHYLVIGNASNDVVATLPTPNANDRLVFNGEEAASGTLTLSSAVSAINGLVIRDNIMLSLIADGTTTSDWNIEYYGNTRLTRASIVDMLDEESDTPLTLAPITNTTKILTIKNTSDTVVAGITGTGEISGATSLFESPAVAAIATYRQVVSTDSSPIQINIKPGNGTLAAPTPLVSSDRLFQMALNGCTTNGNYEATSRAFIRVVASENWSGSAGGFETFIYSRLNGTISGVTGSIGLRNDGEIQFNGADAVGDSGKTPDGGDYVCYTAGETLVAGDVVSFTYNSGNADTVNKVPTSGDRPIGIVYAGVASGAIVKVVNRGRVATYFDSAPLKGSVALTDTATAGRATSSNAPDAANSHWREIGHPTGASVSRESRTLYYIEAHFN